MAQTRVSRLFLLGHWSLTFLLAPSFSGATTFTTQPIEKTIEQAEIIARGTIGMSYSDYGHDREGHKRLFTYTELTVTEVLKGDIPTPSITMRELGGEKEGAKYAVTGTAEFKRGEDTVIFLKDRNSEGSYDISGMMMGKLETKVRGDGQILLLGPALMKQDNPPENGWTLENFKVVIDRVENGESENEETIQSAVPGRLEEKPSWATSRINQKREPAANLAPEKKIIPKKTFSEVLRWLGLGLIALGLLIGIVLLTIAQRKSKQKGLENDQ